MRARLSGMTGEKTILHTIYDYKYYADQLDIHSMMTFTPKEFLESIYRVKSYQVTGTVYCVFDEGYDNSLKVSYGNASITQNIKGTFPITYNKKPPQIYHSPNWFSNPQPGDVIDNSVYGGIGLIEYRDFWPGFSSDHQVINKNCTGSYTVSTRNWNPYYQSQGDYGLGSDGYGWRFSSSIDCAWDQNVRAIYNTQIYFDKDQNKYYFTPHLTGNIVFIIHPTNSSKTSENSIFFGTTNSPVWPDNLKTRFTYTKIGKLTYQNADSKLFEVPIFCNFNSDNSQFTKLECNLRMQVTETWQDSDF